MKLCIDCRHHREGLCKAHPESNMVDGGELLKSCLSTRMNEAMCGRKAAWFEPKEGAGAVSDAQSGA